MYDMENEKYFFLFLLNNANVKQSNVLIKNMTYSQYSILKHLANEILEEDLPLNTRQFKN